MPGTEGQHYPIRGLVLSMARSFCHDSAPAEIKAFCTAQFGITIFRDRPNGNFTILERIDVTAMASPDKGIVPEIFLSGTYTEEEKSVFDALQRRFKRPEKEVVLKYLGPDYV